MDWVKDVALSRAGDAHARQRLGEYLAPFVHGVALAHAAHETVEGAMPRLLDGALARGLLVDDDADVVLVAVAEARRLATELGTKAAREPTHFLEALRMLERLMTLADPRREYLVLRLVEGIPGVELAETLRLDPAVVRRELERGLGELARHSSQRSELGNDRWLWEYAGSPGPFLARLELLLPVLRHEVLVSAAPGRTDDTHLELLPLGRAEGFSDSANPTLPANVLPGEARLGSTTSSRGTELESPAHGMGGDPDRTARHDPDRTGALPTPLLGSSGDEATDRPAMGRDASRRAGAQGRPRRLPRPGGPRVAGDLARTESRPFIQRGASSNETRIGVSSRLLRQWRTGRLPPLLWGAVVVVAVALVAGVSALLGSPSQPRWTLMDVVVAAENLEEGALITSENTAVRSVPRATHAGGEPPELVPVEDVRFVLNQRLVTPVFEGDPLFYTELETTRLERGLSTRLARPGASSGTAESSASAGEARRRALEARRSAIIAIIRGAEHRGDGP